MIIVELHLETPRGKFVFHVVLDADKVTEFIKPFLESMEGARVVSILVTPNIAFL
jgi:hypothetical protein